jgi:hypothetical protein
VRGMDAEPGAPMDGFTASYRTSRKSAGPALNALGRNASPHYATAVAAAHIDA